MRFYLMVAGLFLMLLSPLSMAADDEQNGGEETTGTEQTEGDQSTESESTEGSTDVEPDC